VAVVEQAMEITGCEVCGAGALVPVLDLGTHPLCTDVTQTAIIGKVRRYPGKTEH